MTVNISKPAVNVREKLAELDKPTGIAGEAMLRAETPQEQFNLIGAGRRNIFINGGFTVSQRGDFTSATATSSESYGLDRWKCYLNTVSATYQNTTVTINGVTKKALKMAATSSGTGFFGPVQQVELSAFQVGVDLTMSGYVRTNHPNVYFRHDYVAGATGIQSPNRISNDGSWHYVTWTLNTAGTTQAPIFQVLAYDNGSVSVTSGDYIEIADMQLELGKVATPFEHRSYGEELALCQRYYQKHTVADTYQYIGNVAVAHTTTIIAQNCQLNPTMRAAPTLGSSGWRWKRMTGGLSNVTITGTTIQDATANDVTLNWTVGTQTVGHVGMIESNGTSSAYLAFDAEL